MNKCEIDVNHNLVVLLFGERELKTGEKKKNCSKSNKRPELGWGKEIVSDKER